MTKRDPADLWRRAAMFAAWAHRHQLRKDGHTPYFSHPARVAMTVACLFEQTDPNILAAALLHDVLEDTTADYDDLHREFGREIADIVAALSKDTRLIESQRERRYDRQLAAGPWQARLIKLADAYDNYKDCTTPASRAKQAGRIRRALKVAGNDPRLARAKTIVKRLL